MQYWLWMVSRTKDDDLTYLGVPDKIRELSLSFDDGAPIKRLVPKIAINLGKNDQDRLTDELVAQGTSARVLSEEIISVLHSCGVDNIEYYDFKVINDVTNEEYDKWKLGNIVGVVGCIDFDKSDFEYDEDDGEIEFINKLVLNEEKALECDLKIFRLEGFLPLVIIHDEVKSALEERNFTGHKFMAPSQLVF